MSAHTSVGCWSKAFVSLLRYASKTGLDGDALGSWIGKPRKMCKSDRCICILCKTQIPGGEKIKTIHLGCNRLIWLRYLFERRDIGRAMTKKRSKYFVCH